MESIHKEDKRTLEKVQVRITRVNNSFQDLSYEERLLNLGLTILERRCYRADMIQILKIQNSNDQISWFANSITMKARKKNIYISSSRR